MTIREIAELAGVSAGTVSKIINNKDAQLSEATRKKVLDVIKEYNYKPYANVRTDANPFCIGVCISTEAGGLLRGILRTAQERGYAAIVLYSYGSRIQEQKNLSSLLSRGIAGLIWEPADETRAYVEETEAGIPVPVQKISRTALSGAWYIDFREMARVLTCALLEKKHTEIGCLLRRSSVRSEAFLDGFKKALTENQIVFQEGNVLYSDALDQDPSSYLKNDTAIVSSHYDAALRLYKIAADSHYSIPEELSLVSLRDDARESLSYPQISGLAIPYEEFGVDICHSIIEMCEADGEAQSGAYGRIGAVTDFSSVDVPASHRSPSLLSVGAVNVDHVILSNRLPVSGETLIASQAMETIGGKGANQAVGAARLGMKVALIAKIGDDAEAVKSLDFLNKEGVDPQGVLKEKGGMTGKAFIQLESGGNSTITVLPGANRHLSGSDVRQSAALFKKAACCLISTEIGMEAVLAACSLAVRARVKTILKPASVSSLPQEIYGQIDYFAPNASEAALLAPQGLSVPEQAEYFCGLGAGNVIITLGPDGCYLRTDKETAYLPACQAFHAVDNSGASDAFLSALAVYLTRGYPTADAVRIAQIAAAFCISRVGTASSLVDRVSLENYLAIEEPGLCMSGT